MKEPTVSVVRHFSIDAGHRVFGHESKCAHPHGHTYGIEVHARADALDALGRVVDFSVLKGTIGTWLDAHWDHAFLVNVDDKELVDTLLRISSRVFLMPNNPTAENMALYLLRLCTSVLVLPGFEVFKVVVQETPNCRAEAVQ